jgi:hypothetical protein
MMKWISNYYDSEGNFIIVIDVGMNECDSR